MGSEAGRRSIEAALLMDEGRKGEQRIVLLRLGRDMRGVEASAETARSATAEVAWRGMARVEVGWSELMTHPKMHIHTK